MRGLRRPGEAGDPRARRQERQHRLRRRRPRSGPPRARPMSVFDNAGQDCCARSRILVQRSVFDRFLELLEPAVAAFVVARPARGDAADGPADPRGPARPRAVLRRGRVAVDVAFRGSAPTAPGFWYPADGAAARAGRPRCGARRSSGPSSSVLPFDDEADAVAAGQRHRRTACPARSGPETSGRALRVARGVEAGNLSVNSHSACATGRRSAGSSSPGSAASSGPTRSTRSPTPRTSSSPRTEPGRGTTRGLGHGRTTGGTGGRRHRWRAAASASRRCAGSRRRAPASSSATSTRPTGRASPRRSAALFVRLRRHRRRSRSSAVPHGEARRYGSVDIAFNNAGISPPEDDSILTTGLEAWRRVQEVNLT